MIRRMLAAVQFLTIVPVGGGGAGPAEGAAFFPVVGGILGAAAGALFVWASARLGVELAALFAVLLLVVLTGGLHEDGLADAADAFRAGRTPEKILAILKDSRIGSYGGLAIAFSVAIRWQAIARAGEEAILGMTAALAVSRAAMPVLAAFTPAVGEGLGAAFCRGISKVSAAVACVIGAAIAIAAMRWRGAAMLAAAGILVLLARAYFLKRIGGVNGDCLGATCQAVEMASLVILAWRPSI